MNYFWVINVLFLAAAIQSYCHEQSKDLEIFLNDIRYQDGVFSSNNGGYLQGDSFYLQANNLTFTKKAGLESPENNVKAENQIALYKNKILFLGDSCFYDFIQEKGWIENAKTTFGIYLIEAKRLILNTDKSYDAFDVIVSTCCDDSVFSITMKHLRFYDESKIQASSSRLNVGKVPILWIPKWQYVLNSSSESPIRYRLSWDTGQGPQVSFRYKVLSYKDFNLFLRADYRYKRGPAGAIEMDYLSQDGLIKFLSNNYGAYDTFYNDDNPNQKLARFRFQTIFNKTSEDHRSGIDLTFDRITDKNMPQDFNMDRFELNTQKKNKCDIFLQDSFYKAHALITPRVNGYQGFNQKIPEFNLHLHPLSFFNSSLLFYNNFKLSFYDYAYSNMLVYPEIYTPVLQDFHSIRAETNQKITYPCSLNFIKILPALGFKGIIYTNSPSYMTAYQGIVDYGLKTFSSLEKKCHHFKHVVTPYLDYQGLYQPALSPQKVYIFSIEDGYFRLNQLTFGLQQQFLSNNCPSSHVSINCYGLSFFKDSTYKLIVPKAGINISSNFDNLTFSTHIRWNFNNHVLDIGNVSMAYTLNSIISWKLEFRYRSAYDWRKCDHENYILDVTRPIEELLNSPISDKRFTLISNASVYLAPKWRCNLQMHNGWGRKNEPGYTEAKVDLTTLVSTFWKLHLSYMFTTRGKSHFGLKIELNK